MRPERHWIFDMKDKGMSDSIVGSFHTEVPDPKLTEGNKRKDLHAAITDKLLTYQKASKPKGYIASDSLLAEINTCTNIILSLLEQKNII